LAVAVLALFLAKEAVMVATLLLLLSLLLEAVAAVILRDHKLQRVVLAVVRKSQARVRPEQLVKVSRVVMVEARLVVVVVVPDKWELTQAA
jgi:hypothetical protein